MTETLAPITCCAPLAAPTLSRPEAEATAGLFRALADPARVKIVNLLARSPEPVCACDIIPALGLAQATVSKIHAPREGRRYAIAAASKETP